MLRSVDRYDKHNFNINTSLRKMNFKMDCIIKVSYIIALENIIHIPFIFLPTELLC